MLQMSLVLHLIAKFAIYHFFIWRWVFFNSHILLHCKVISFLHGQSHWFNLFFQQVYRIKNLTKPNLHKNYEKVSNGGRKIKVYFILLRLLHLYLFNLILLITSVNFTNKVNLNFTRHHQLQDTIPPSTVENQLADDLNEFYCRFEKTPLTSPGTPISSLLHSRSVKMMCARASQSEQLAPIFTQIFNRSLELCEVPSWFKHFTIIPIQEKPKITGLNYYRPVVTKSFEKLVLAYLKDITGPLLDPLKFAFRANRSVDDAVNMGLYVFL